MMKLLLCEYWAAFAHELHKSQAWGGSWQDFSWDGKKELNYSREAVKKRQYYNTACNFILCVYCVRFLQLKL